MRPFLRSLVAMILLPAGLGLVGAQTTLKPDLIASQEPFTPSGVIGAADSRILGPGSRTEEGELNGVKYKFYYSDGSGTFVGTRGNAGTYADPIDSNWNVTCSKDPISDKRICYMHLKDLWIYVFQNNTFLLKIGSDHFPGSTVAIRIDKGKPISTTAQNDGVFPPQTSAKLIAQMKTASEVTVRHMKWPYRSWIDETWDLYGFKEAVQYISWAVTKIR